MPKSKVRKKKTKTKSKNSNVYEAKNIFSTREESVKMSEVLLDFAQPMLERAKDMEQKEKALTLAVIAWNLGVLPSEDRENFQKNIDIVFGDDEILLQDGREIIEMMLARKEKYFKDIKRMIIDYNISYIGDEINVQVASTEV